MKIELIHGDCLEKMKDIPDDSIDLICTDPPYKLTPRGSSGTMSGYWADDKAKCGKVFNHNDIEIEAFLPEFYRVLKDGTHCYIMCNHLNLPHFIEVINSSKFKFVKCLIWDKQRKICGRYYMGQFEYIIMLRKGRERTINNCGTSDILSIPLKRNKDNNGNNIHDSEKPVRLMELLIENSSNEGELVLEPFLGSGTTAVACKNLNRCCIGIEIDDKYFAIAEKRIKEAQQQLTFDF
jgi:site-specific DNA-methyltransferase (adenine-specific)